MNKPFKIRHKASGLFYRPVSWIKHESTGEWVKTNLTKTGGKIYTRDPRKHISWVESHLANYDGGRVINAFDEFEIVQL